MLGELNPRIYRKVIDNRMVISFTNWKFTFLMRVEDFLIINELKWQFFVVQVLSSKGCKICINTIRKSISFTCHL